MHARWLVPPIAALLLFSGCARPAPEPTDDEVARAPQAPAPRAPADAPCTLGEARTALSTDAPVAALGLAHGPGGSVLVAAIDERTLAFTRLDAAGAPVRTVRAPFPRARGLVAATGWGARTAAVGHGPCLEGVAAATCLHLTALEGGAVLEPISIPLPQPIARLRIAASEDLLVVARSHAEGPAFVDLVRVADGRLAAESVGLADARFPGAHHTEALAAAASGDRYAVVIRVGAIEDPTGALVLATPAGLVELEPLHEAAMVDALAFDPARPDTLALLASFEWSRPRVFRVGPGGTLGDEAVVAHGAEAGPPFARDEVGRLGRDADGLWLRRTTLGGDAIDAPFRLAGPAPARAALARRDGDYLVALAPREAPYGVRATTVRCASR